MSQFDPQGEVDVAHFAMVDSAVVAVVGAVLLQRVDPVSSDERG